MKATPNRFKIRCPLDLNHNQFTAWASSRILSTFNSDGIANGSVTQEHRHPVCLYRSPEADDIWVCAICGSDAVVEVEE